MAGLQHRIHPSLPPAARCGLGQHSLMSTVSRRGSTCTQKVRLPPPASPSMACCARRNLPLSRIANSTCSTNNVCCGTGGDTLASNFHQRISWNMQHNHTCRLLAIMILTGSFHRVCLSSPNGNTNLVSEYAPTAWQVWALVMVAGPHRLPTCNEHHTSVPTHAELPHITHPATHGTTWTMWSAHTTHVRCQSPLRQSANTHIHKRTHTHPNTRANTHTHTHTRARGRMRAHARSHACTHARTHARTYT